MFIIDGCFKSCNLPAWIKGFIGVFIGFFEIAFVDTIVTVIFMISFRIMRFMRWEMFHLVYRWVLG